ncbi:LysR family transcriptional regulator [Microlunatus speluncae]|uniref:LysR family transcriptional regulator n=1 Tax=Microlunatus speluncae TaxID=2594267 RepID=UPI001375B662|nr:LysR family transcriptional regulator [Microlunatus speluncae]
MLDLRQLRVLSAVAESGSMTRAAERLSYTASAVSQQMAALERQVGAPLLVRHARGARLTEVGRVLREHAEAVDERLRTAEREVRDLIELRAGRLRLGAFASAASRLIPDAITEFRRRHADITLSLDILDPVFAVEAVTAGRLDLAVVFDYPPGPTLDVGDLTREVLLDDPVLVAVQPGHPCADKPVVSVAELSTEPWIRDCGPDPMCRDMLDRFCREGGFSPTIAFEADNYLTIGRLVEAGVAVALVPGLAADQMPEGVALRPLAPAVSRRVSAVFRPGATPSALQMISVLRTSSPDRLSTG